MSRLSCLFLSLVLLAPGGPLVVAQSPPARDQTKAADRAAAESAAKPAKNTKPEAARSRAGSKHGDGRGAGEVAVTPGREAAALTFARLHHPELAELLAHLKDANRGEYRRAIRELFQTSERLARLSERSPRRYELALKAWKIDSRVRLLAARMTMTDDPALEDELKATLQERLSVRLEQLHYERDRAAERLKMLESSLERLERDPETALNREFERVTRNLRGTRQRGAGGSPVRSKP